MRAEEKEKIRRQKRIKRNIEKHNEIVEHYRKLNLLTNTRKTEVIIKKHKKKGASINEKKTV